MAHERWYFLKSEKNYPEGAAYALNIFIQLYDIEWEIKDKMIQKRDRNCANLYGLCLEQWLKENAGMLSDKRAIYKAFAYTMMYIDLYGKRCLKHR